MFNPDNSMCFLDPSLEVIFAFVLTPVNYLEKTNLVSDVPVSPCLLIFVFKLSSFNLILTHHSIMVPILVLSQFIRCFCIKVSFFNQLAYGFYKLSSLLVGEDLYFTLSFR
jgi:hypothetical protein